MLTLSLSILVAVTICFAVACVLLRKKNHSFEGMVCKFMASFGFAAIAIAGNYYNPGIQTYFSLIMTALLFGFCGDVFLGIKEIAPTFKKKLIALGTVSFMVGHLFYIAAFIHVFGFDKLTLIFPFIGLFVPYIGFNLLKSEIKNSLLALICVYYAILMYKVGYSIFVISHNLSVETVMILAGCLLFIISDTCLGLIYFTPIKKKNIFVTVELSTYYIAQILFAMTVAFI